MANRNIMLASLVLYQERYREFTVIFISNKQKCYVFLFMFLLFFSAKSENRREEHVLPRGQHWPQWKEESGGEKGLRG
jgi:hypothetical protein